MSGETCVVLVDVGDALAVGLSLKVVARGQSMPAETREVYNRVGEQLVSAARVEVAQAASKVRGSRGVL